MEGQMRTFIAVFFAVLLSGCAAGQRYTECTKQYPEPQNVFWSRGAANSTSAGSFLLSSMLASAFGEDQGAYNQWQQTIALCVDQKTAAAQ